MRRNGFKTVGRKERACVDKKRLSYKEAKSAIRIGRKNGEFDINIYKCPYCHFFHVGHRSWS